jgi:hypothetical protein
LLFLLFSHLAYATTYYVDSVGGLDINNGTSNSTPWQTIAKVNSSTFNPGDSILFDAGDTWREQLTIPASGSAGNPITFSSYGNGANPIISGANLIGGGGWTQGDPLDYENYASGTVPSYWGTVGDVATSSVVYGTEPYSWLFATSTANITESYNINSNYAEFVSRIYLSSSSAMANGGKGPLVVFEGSAWNGANAVKVWISRSGTQYQMSIGRGGAIGSTPYNISTSTWYWIRAVVSANGGNSTDSAQLYIASGTANYPPSWGSSVSSITGMSLTTPVNSDITFGNGLGYNANILQENFADTYVFNTNSTVQPNIWYTSLSAAPSTIMINGVAGSLRSSAQAITSANQWYWGANQLYIYATSSPSTAYTSPGVEVPTRSYTFQPNGKSYIAISNLTFEGASAGSIDGTALLSWGSGQGDDYGPSVHWQLSGVNFTSNADGDSGWNMSSTIRDWRMWPFSQSSPWNTSIGSNATYASVSFSGVSGYGITTSNSTVAIGLAQTTDPQVSLFTNTAYPGSNWNYLYGGGTQCNATGTPAAALLANSVSSSGPYQQNTWSTLAIASTTSPSANWEGTVYFPNGMCPSPDADGHMAIFQPNGTVLETYATVVLSNRNIIGDQITSFTNPKGDGAGDENGRRASLIPNYAGLIRTGELTSGIPHALAMLTPPILEKAQAVWPAYAYDTNTSSYAGTLPMGTLLAIPPSVNIYTLGLSAKGLVLARAAQDYGVYDADTGGGGVTYLSDLNNPDVANWSNYTSDITTITQHLEQVTNNTLPTPVEQTQASGGQPPLLTLRPLGKLCAGS